MHQSAVDWRLQAYLFCLREKPFEAATALKEWLNQMCPAARTRRQKLEGKPVRAGGGMSLRSPHDCHMPSANCRLWYALVIFGARIAPSFPRFLCLLCFHLLPSHAPICMDLRIVNEWFDNIMCDSHSSSTISDFVNPTRLFAPVRLMEAENLTPEIVDIRVPTIPQGLFWFWLSRFSFFPGLKTALSFQESAT